MNGLQKLLASRPKAGPSGGGGGGTSWSKRGELEKQRQEEYLRQRDEDLRKKKEMEMKRANELLAFQEEAAKRRARLRARDASDEPSEEASVEGEADNLPEDYVMDVEELHETFKGLRILGEPCTLFGESDKARLQRLFQSQAEARAQVDLGTGVRNTYQKIHKEMAENGGSQGHQEIQEANDFHALEGTTEGLIRAWIKKILDRWSADLDARPDEEKKSGEGKAETARFRQTKEYLKPLLKKLRAGGLASLEASVKGEKAANYAQVGVDPGIRDRLQQIVEHAERKEYKRAHDAYMLLSIGNAPWPVGVTQWGIHDRAANDRTTKVAHILNDETTRKFIQCTKRLLSKAQSVWPAADPSMMVLG